MKILRIIYLTLKLYYLRIHKINLHCKLLCILHAINIESFIVPIPTHKLRKNNHLKFEMKHMCFEPYIGNSI